MTDQLAVIDFNSPDQIQKYWETLGKLGLQYHLDDDPKDCFIEGDTCDILVRNNQSLWQYCEENQLDPWDYIELDLCD